MSEHDRETWLSTIRSNPSDWQAMLVFADWLEEEGDLLAAEQWRIIALFSSAGLTSWVMTFPNHYIIPIEYGHLNKHNIRCMPTYPQTIEDVQSYFSQLESVDSR